MSRKLVVTEWLTSLGIVPTAAYVEVKATISPPCPTSVREPPISRVMVLMRRSASSPPMAVMARETAAYALIADSSLREVEAGRCAARAGARARRGRKAEASRVCDRALDMLGAPLGVRGIGRPNFAQGAGARERQCRDHR